MDYSIQRDLNEQEKLYISNWLKNSLLEYMDECDDVFLEYVVVMILNGKTMLEISTDLEAFIGQPACSNLASSLGQQLRQLINQDEKSEENSIDQSSKIIKIGRKDHSDDPRFSEGLKSSRDRDGSSRLVQSALKSTLGSNEKKRTQSKNDAHIQNKEHKRQRVVRVEEGEDRGFMTSHGPRTAPTLDPQAWMNTQAQQNGFANVEEMMAAYFQKNMLAMMQNMSQSGVFPVVPNGYPSAFPPPYAEGYHYSPRGRGRFGRTFRGAPTRGRGFYSAGRGRGETGEPSVPTQSPSESNPQENTVSNNPETNNEVHEPNESVSAQNVDSSTFPTRGRFRGRASGFRGRGRLAGRAIRGRNKTWVRGPGVETPLTTDR